MVERKGVINRVKKVMGYIPWTFIAPILIVSVIAVVLEMLHRM